MEAVEVEGVSKRYGRGDRAVRALAGLSFAVPRGGIFGLLGPNGAGKSTLMRIVAGLVFADEGEVLLFGERASAAGRRRLGAMIESANFYPFLTAAETLEVLSRTSGCRIAAGTLLARVGLAAAANRRVGTFSLGMKQRLGIAAALIGEPDLLLLDEPANGLDPPGTLELRKLLRALADEDGITIIMSSHLLDEVERLCDRVAILDRGTLKAEGDLASLLGGGEQLWLDASPSERVLARVGERGRPHAGGVAVSIARAETPALLKALGEEGVAIYEARWLRPGLERFFRGEESR
ncbi:MAG TPA: ABC transporter ATP-binding protein [Allosphingosinicella sp.]|jgi:ABC-2 type transport system ATP-binding protein|nr:ABC transporter ATP-binding protein [Allosphingosinicella sp.]